MTCHDARELFSALLDDALTSEERAPLDAHLATCGECGHELEGFRGAVALVRGLPPDRAPAGFVDRLVAVARPEPWTTRLARRLFLPWTVKLPLEAAALLLVGGLAVLVFRGTEEQQRAARVDEPRARIEQPAPIPGVAGREPEPPGPAPDVASRPAQPPAARQDQTWGARDAAGDLAKDQQISRRVPTQAPPPHVPAPSRAPEAPKASASPQAPGARQETGASGEAADGASAPRPEAPPRREAPPPLESDRRQKSGRAQESTGQAAPPGTQAEGTARGSTPREDVARDESAGRLGGAARSAAVADVGGTLLVADARAAAAKIEDIARGLGGSVAARRENGEALLLEVAVPRQRYSDLVRELTRIGQWRPRAEPPALPPSVHVVIRLTR